MNKLLMFPITMMFFLSVYTITSTGETYTGSTENYSEITLPNESVVNIPQYESYDINLWIFGGSMALLALAFGIGIVGGVEISFFGSSFQMSDYSLHVAFNALIFSGIWGALTGFSYGLVMSTWIITFAWVGITIMYIIGVVMQINAVGE